MACNYCAIDGNVVYYGQIICRISSASYIYHWKTLRFSRTVEYTRQLDNRLHIAKDNIVKAVGYASAI